MVTARVVLFASAAIAAASFTGQEANAVHLRAAEDTTLDSLDALLDSAPFAGGKGLTPPLKARFEDKTLELVDATKTTRQTAREGKKAINLALKDVQTVTKKARDDTRGVAWVGKKKIDDALKAATWVYEKSTKASKAAAKDSEQAAVASREAVAKGQQAMKKYMHDGKQAMAKLWGAEREANKQAVLATATEVERAMQAAKDARVAAEEGMTTMTGVLDDAKEANKVATSTTTTSSQKGDLAMKEELLNAKSANKEATKATIESVNQANQAMKRAMKFALKQALTYGTDSVVEVKKAAKEVIEKLEAQLAAAVAAREAREAGTVSEPVVEEPVAEEPVAAAAVAEDVVEPKFVSLGCFKDGYPRTLGEAQTGGATPETCNSYCGERGFSHFGLQWKTQCFCGGETYDKLGSLDDSKCNTPCSALPDVMCGGLWANNVYEVNGGDIA